MKTKILTLFCLPVIVIVATSCVTQRRLLAATAKLEQVEESQNYFGKIAVSDLDFVANKGQFAVNYNEDPSNYVQAARNNVSGNSSSSVQSALYMSAALQAMFAPPISAGAPVNWTNMPGSNSPPAQPTMPTQAEAALNSFPAASALNTNPTMDERDAVQKGINDKLAEEFLEFMANPSADSNSEAIVFGVMQATCEPGQETRKGYIAELDVTLRYARTKQNPIGTAPRSINRLEMPVNPYFDVNQTALPSVLAVLPLMDSRNMALQNNNQSQIEVALALSAAFAAKGMTAAANILSDYVKRQQSNIQTLNSLPVTTTYSDGSDFGFQIYPAAQALENPGKPGSSGNVLAPVTFPIVVAIKVDKSQVENPNGPWKFLSTETGTRWIPIKSNFLLWLGRKFGIFSIPFFPINYGANNNFSLIQTEVRAEKIDKANEILKDLVNKNYIEDPTNPSYFEYQQLKIAIDSLEASALSLEACRPLPDSKELFPSPVPSIVNVFPHTIWRDTNTDFVILVNGITNSETVEDVTIAGVICPPTNVVTYGTYYETNDICGATTTNFVPQGMAIEAILPDFFYSVTNTVTNNVDFAVVFKEGPPITKTIGLMLQGRTIPEPNAIISRDSNEKVVGINIQPGQQVTEVRLLKAINKILEKSELAPKTVNIVH